MAWRVCWQANAVNSTLGVLGPAGQDKLSLHACDPRAMGVWASCWGYSKAGNGEWVERKERR